MTDFGIALPSAPPSPGGISWLGPLFPELVRNYGQEESDSTFGIVSTKWLPAGSLTGRPDPVAMKHIQRRSRALVDTILATGALY